MFTYTAIFLGCLVAALAIRWVYNMIMDSSGSVYSAKASTPLVTSPVDHPKAKTKAAASGVAYEPKNWPENVRQIREQQPQYTPHDDTVRHCSLYSVNTEKPASTAKQNVSWPRREDKVEPAGKAYKVTRRVAPAGASPDTEGKPWGW